MKSSRVDEIKALLTIPDVAGRVFSGWKAAKSCKSPFRKDKNASFSIYANGQKWKDHATGDGGDVIDFYSKATGRSTADAIRELALMSGIADESVESEESKILRLPELHQGVTGELGTLAKIRHLSMEGLQLATERGLLRFADMPDAGQSVTVWIITDSKRLSAQARRMDGLPLHTKVGATVKAKSLYGSKRSWPIGLPEAATYPHIVLVEGGPDLLAAYHFIRTEDREIEVAPVAMLGAANHIPAEALPMFAGKSVRIFPHLDEAGSKAALRWTLLRQAGIEAHCFDLSGLTMTNGSAVNDLNDVSSVSADCFEAERDIWNVMTWTRPS